MVAPGSVSAAPDELFEREVPMAEVPGLLAGWHEGDAGGLVHFGSIHGPALLAAYQGRREHRDRGAFAVPFFGDGLILAAAQRGELELTEADRAKLLSGLFCVDVPGKSVAHVRCTAMDLGRDAYRATELPPRLFSQGTAVDLVDALKAANYSFWEGIIGSRGIHSSVLTFGTELTRAQLLQRAAVKN